MQDNSSFLPLVQKFILDNMPHGGFNMVSIRLNSKGKCLSGRQVMNELRTLKKELDTDVVLHSLMFLKDNEVKLSNYCEEWLVLSETKKAR